MDTQYQRSLAAVTGPEIQTQWVGDCAERDGVPPVDSNFRPTLDVWLSNTSSNVAKDPAVRSSIKTTWISFLSATCTDPDTTLAPLAKKVRWGMGTETEKDRRKRFHHDRRNRRCIQCVVWGLFDGLEALSERWPAAARLVLNRLTDGSQATHF